MTWHVADVSRFTHHVVTSLSDFYKITLRSWGFDKIKMMKMLGKFRILRVSP